MAAAGSCEASGLSQWKNSLMSAMDICPLLDPSSKRFLLSPIRSAWSSSKIELWLAPRLRRLVCILSSSSDDVTLSCSELDV